MFEIECHSAIAPPDIAIFLRKLDEANLRIGAVRHGAAQTVRLHDIIRIDDENEIGGRIHETSDVVQGAGFEAFEIFDVEKTEARPQFAAELGHRTP